MIRIQNLAVIGIDTKLTKMAYTAYLGDDHPPIVKSFNIPTKHHSGRALSIPERVRTGSKWVGDEINALVIDGWEVMVFIEEPIVARNRRTAMQLAKVAGAVIDACYEAAGIESVHVYEVEVSSWKIATEGRGNATKAQVQAWCYKYWGAAYEQCLVNGKPDEDRCDSAAICYYGIDVVKMSARRERRSKKLVSHRR